MPSLRGGGGGGGGEDLEEGRPQSPVRRPESPLRQGPAAHGRSPLAAAAAAAAAAYGMRRITSAPSLGHGARGGGGGGGGGDDDVEEAPAARTPLAARTVSPYRRSRSPPLRSGPAGFGPPPPLSAAGPGNVSRSSCSGADEP